ncbi:MAG: putative phosphoesterase [Natronomonas sp.]|jgi:putative phosphoesterase
MELAIISDTHIPSRASAIPDPFRDRLRRADRVVHAGDVDSAGALADVESLATDLTAVAGNTDPEVGLPRSATVEVGGVTLAVTHGAGSPRGYQRRLTAAGRDVDADVVVGGHTHEPLDTIRDGVRLLNPGSATGAWPADLATMLTARPDDDGLAVQRHESR